MQLEQRQSAQIADGKGLKVKPFKIVLLSIFLLIVTAVVVFASLFFYEKYFQVQEVYRVDGPDGRSVFVLCQVGQPDWPFGPVGAQIKTLDAQGKIVDRKSIVVNTDGAQLSKYNVWELNWSEESLEVVIVGEDGTAAYVLKLPKS